MPDPHACVAAAAPSLLPSWGLPDWVVITYLAIAFAACCVLAGRVYGHSLSGLGDDPVSAAIALVMLAPFAAAGLVWPLWLPVVAAGWWGWWRRRRRRGGG